MSQHFDLNKAQTDLELVRDLKIIFQRFVDDQKQIAPSFRSQELPLEIHGPLADMLYIDDVKNDALVNFIVSLMYTYEGRDDKEIIRLVQDINQILADMITGYEKYIEQTKTT